jgi:hypothetical protein
LIEHPIIFFIQKLLLRKKVETIYEPFAAIIQKFALPWHLRLDFAAKRVLICEHLKTEWPHAPQNPFLVGASWLVDFIIR